MRFWQEETLWFTGQPFLIYVTSENECKNNHYISSNRSTRNANARRRVQLGFVHFSFKLHLSLKILISEEFYKGAS